jgi:hypothetical protein
MANRSIFVFVAFTVLWVVGVALWTGSDKRLLRGAAANVLHVIQAARL